MIFTHKTPLIYVEGTCQATGRKFFSTVTVITIEPVWTDRTGGALASWLVRSPLD